MSEIAIDWSKYMKGLEGKANINLDNITKQSKESFSNLSAPNWNAKVTQSVNQEYTAVSNGYILYIPPVSGYTRMHLIINGFEMNLGQEVSGTDYPHPSNCILPLAKGDKYTLKQTNGTWYFLPTKGASL